MTMAELVDLYAKEGCVIQRGKRQGQAMKALTKAYTLARLRHHVVPLLGRKRISEIRPRTIEQFVRDVAAGKTAKDEKVGKRRRILRYLESSDLDRYRSLVADLGLRR